MEILKDNQIREAVAKATDIMDLKFGCEVMMKNSDFVGTGDKFFTIDEAVKSVIIDYNPGGFNGEDYDSDNALIYCHTWDIHRRIEGLNLDDKDDAEYIEILGRPIQLADILRTIKKISVEKPYLYEYEVQKLLELWDLSKSYEDQSDEVKEFIFNLLI